LPELFARDYLTGPLQQRCEHQERVVFHVQGDAPLIELPFCAVEFEDSETDPGWFISRCLVQMTTAKRRVFSLARSSEDQQGRFVMGLMASDFLHARLYLADGMPLEPSGKI
jgi:hypothetical protein